MIDHPFPALSFSSPIMNALAITFLSATVGVAVCLVIYGFCLRVVVPILMSGEPAVIHTDPRTTGLPEVSEYVEPYREAQPFGHGWLFTPAEREARREIRDSLAAHATATQPVGSVPACGAWARRPTRVITARSGVLAGERVRVIGESGEYPGVWFVVGRGGRVTVLEGVWDE